MARFKEELPLDVMKQLEDLQINHRKMFGEMCKSGANVTYNNIVANMRRVFSDTTRLLPCLKMTRVYETPSDDGINVKVAFYGYLANDSGKKVKISYSNKKRDGRRSKTYTYEKQGIPAPLVAMAREYGTTSGEVAKPFLRMSFKKSQIESAMKQVQKKYGIGD